MATFSARLLIGVTLLVLIVVIWLNSNKHPQFNATYHGILENIDRREAFIRNVAENESANVIHLNVPPVVKIYEKTTAYFLNRSQNISYVLQRSSLANLSNFIAHVKYTVISRKIVHMNPGKLLTTVLHFPPYFDIPLPYCDGLWMEFGVFDGGTVNHIARWKTSFCGNHSGPVYGFDTFSGLPTAWRPGFEKGAFSVNIDQLRVEPNVILVKGLFIDSLPQHLFQHDDTPVSFVHIDCDIYDGARDVLFLLASRFVKGTILIFDELFNYPGYEQHEIKALYEFLIANRNLKLQSLGSAHPVLFDNVEGSWESQSTGFVVV